MANGQCISVKVLSPGAPLGYHEWEKKAVSLLSVFWFVDSHHVQGVLAMSTPNHLGPHTVPVQHEHQKHWHWLHRFLPKQRHELVEEDRRARTTVAIVLCSAMGFGLLLLIATVLELRFM